MTFRWSHVNATADSSGKFTVTIGTEPHSGEEIKTFGGFVESGNSTSNSENANNADRDVSFLGSSSYFEPSNEVEYVILSWRGDVGSDYRAHVWIKV